MEYSLAIEKINLPLASKWLQLEESMLSEISQAQKHKIPCFPLYMRAKI